MKEVLKKELCTGCSACESICPKNAITLIEKEDGFKYPVIDQNKCINCGLCKRVCPVLNTNENKSLNRSYLAYNKDEEELKTSSSGAIFSLIANYILDNNGIVIGASFTKPTKLQHIAITKKEDLEKLKGSKYLQSDVNNIFHYIKEIINDKKVLFVGTPCQVAGLKAYVKDHKNLYCIDLICHGVPSPKIFEQYIKELEEKNNDSLINYNFRDKVTGWENYSNTAIFKNKKITSLASENNYMKIFLSDIALRESCYKCNFKIGNKYSDITLGDFWGVYKYYPTLSKNGVSAVIINTEKGMNIFECIKENAITKECNIDEILNGNPSLSLSASYPKKREKFFNELNKKSIDYLCKEYTHKSFAKKCFDKLKNLKNK